MPKSSPAGLFYLLAHGAVRVKTVDRHAAGIVVSDQHVSARRIHRNMDGPCDQRYRLAERLKGAGRIDAKGGDSVLVATRRWSGSGADGTAVAPRNIEDWFRRMPPSVLDVGRERDRRALGERGALEIHVVLREFGANAGVERDTGGFCNHGRRTENEA